MSIIHQYRNPATMTTCPSSPQQPKATMSSSNYSTKNPFYVVLSLTLIVFWSIIATLVISFLNSENSPPYKNTPLCTNGIIHRRKCYCPGPANNLHCRILSPEVNTSDLDSGAQDVLSPESDTVKNIVMYFALGMSIIGMAVQMAVLNGWWKPWGMRVVLRRDNPECGLFVVGTAKDGDEYGEKTPLLASSR